MKMIVAMATLLLTSTSFAGKCRLSSIVKVSETMSCEDYSMSVEVSDEASCVDVAKKTASNKFFNTIDNNDELVKTSYKFNDSENEFIFSDSSDC